MANLKVILALLFCLVLSFPSEGKRVRTKLNAASEKRAKTKESNNGKRRGCFEVTAATEADDTTYRLDKIRFTGYDKKINSSRESFFITNNNARTLAGVELTIDYLTEDGRQLHQRTQTLDCLVPSGETRKIDIRSWDNQNSFYYIKSAPNRTTGTPFIVRFTPARLYLKY